MAVHPMLHEPVTGNDQRRDPPAPGEAVTAESFNVNNVQPVIAASSAYQWAILTGGESPELKATEFQMVEQPLRDHQVWTVLIHGRQWLTTHASAAGLGSADACPDFPRRSPNRDRHLRRGAR